MTFYGLADSSLTGTEFGEVIELYVRREDAEQATRDVLEDEPSWEGDVSVVPVAFPFSAQLCGTHSTRAMATF